MITQIMNNNSRCMYDTAVVLVNVIVDLDYKCLSKCTLDVCLKLPKLSYLTDANACGWKRVTPVAAWWLLRTSGGGALSNIHRPRMETRQEVRLWLDIIRKLFVGKIQFRNENGLQWDVRLEIVFRMYGKIEYLQWYYDVLLETRLFE